MTTDRGKRDDGDQQRSSGQMVSTAVSLGFTVVVFVVIGIVLDNVFKTTPLFIFIGIFFALASMAYLMWQLLKMP